MLMVQSALPATSYGVDTLRRRAIELTGCRTPRTTVELWESRKQLIRRVVTFRMAFQE